MHPAKISNNNPAFFKSHAGALLGLSLTLALATTGAVGQQPGPAEPTPQERAAQLKQWLQASRGQLRSYQWIETTTVSQDGTVKPTAQAQCLEDADGKVQRAPLPGAPASSSGVSNMPGLLPPVRLAKMFEKHQEKEMTDYFQSAEALMKSYLPPDPILIQNAVTAGNLSVQPIVPGSQVRLVFANFQKPGDSLGADIALANNQLLGIHVSSYLSAPDDAVELDAKMSTLPDGTIHMSSMTLDGKSKKVTVTMENSDYRLIGR